MPLTKLNATLGLTGSLPAVSGANLTGISSDFVLIKTVTASNVSNVTFDHGSDSVVFDNTYKCYFVNVHQMYGATDNEKIFAYARVSGSNSSSNFRQQIVYNTYNGSSSTNPASAPNNNKLYQNAGTVRNSSPEYFNGQFYFYGIGLNTRMAIIFSAIYKNNSGSLHHETGSSGSDNTETVNGFRFEMGGGNMYGTISLYGIKT